MATISRKDLLNLVWESVDEALQGRFDGFKIAEQYADVASDAVEAAISTIGLEG